MFVFISKKIFYHKTKYLKTIYSTEFLKLIIQVVNILTSKNLILTN